MNNKNIIALPSKKRNRKKQTALGFLKQHVSSLDLGMMVERDDGSKGPVHLNKNADVLAHFENLRNKRASWLNHSWNWIKLRYHELGEQTYYFCGTGERRKPVMIFMLDVDCKRFGSPEGAQQFLKYLASQECRETYGLHFPNLYAEVSTNGRGGHGYVLLHKQDHDAQFINPLLLRRLAPWLNKIAKEQGFDVELVEVKGTAPVITWGEKKGEVLTYTAGTLAKVPRQIQSRFDELRQTATITVNDLLRLPVAEKKTKDRSLKIRVVSSSSGAGSISGEHFGEETLAGLKDGGRYMILAEQLSEHHDLKTSGRHVATLKDKAIALMIGEFFTKNLNPDGSMPVKRWEKLWIDLHGCEDIDRAWDHHRFKAVRDWLDSLGLIQWQDQNYTVGWVDGQGEYHKGKASKWKFSAELMTAMESMKSTETTGTDERIETTTDNMGRGEHPLWAHSISQWIGSIVPKSNDAIIRPVEATNERQTVHRWRVNPEDLAEIVTPYHALAA